jgi:Leucine-rich repeat (LRR) protein
MQKHLSLPFLLLGLLLLVAFNGPKAIAQGDQCPRIYRDGSVLRTDSAQSYQWYKNGEPIPGATEQTYQPLGAPANYSVEVQGRASAAFGFALGQEGSLVGQAFDEYLRPVANARITVANLTTASDAQGRFRIGITTVDSAILLRGEKAGHWTSQRRISPNGPQTHVQLMLRSQPFEHELSAERGGTISRGAFFLTLQPNGVLDANNQPYTGVVKIALNGGRPDDPNFGWMMPGGDFMAQDAQGRERILYSYGFLSAHLQTPSGQPLKLDPNIGAQLRFMMPHTMVANAPDSLPLWHFDEAAAIWKEEGLARREGAAYVGTVRHFSSWNCDVPSERATVRGRVLDCKGRPITRSPIRVGQAFVTTDTSGLYTSFVPSQIEFEVKSLGQNQVGTLNVEPLQPQVVENLSDLQSSGSGLYANSVIDTNNILTIRSYGTRGKVEYSIDSGATFQNSNSFKTHIDSSYYIVVRDSLHCPTIVGYLRVGTKAACQLLDSLSYRRYKWHKSIQEGQESINPVYKLELKDSVFNQFPNSIPFLFPCLHALYFHQNRLPNLNESIFNLNQLRHFTFSSNMLTSLPESIGNLGQLEYLNLEGNLLTTLPESIRILTQLRQIELSDNQLTSIPDFIGNLTKLRQIDFSNNQLTSLPESIGNLAQLKGIVLSNNQLANLPESMRNLSNLLSLSIDNNNFTDIPEFIGTFTKLISIDISKNNLNYIPDWIGNLNNLKYLSIENCNVSILPDWIFGFSQLKILNLKNNRISSLPANISNLADIDQLFLNNNQLTSIPETIGSLYKMREVYLDDNQLTSLPESIGNLTDLETVWLENNQLTSLPASIGNLTNLNNLRLKGNPIPPAEVERIRRLLPNCEIQF